MSDVLKFFLAEIDERFFDAITHLPVRILREADAARIGDTFEPRCNVDSITHQIAVVFLDHITQMDADAKLNPALGGRPALRSNMPFCTSMAQRTASTTLRNSR